MKLLLPGPARSAGVLGMLRSVRRRGLSAAAVLPLLAVVGLAGCTAAPQHGQQAAPTVAATVTAPSSRTATPSTGPTSSPASSPASTPAFDLSRHSLDDPRSIWVVVDKQRPLRPKSWVPEDLVAPRVPHTNAPLLRKPAARALERMVAAAKEDGVGIVSLSAYRAYTVQKSIYDRNLASMGRAATERLTARPGYSEHQTGLADDLGDSSGRCPIQACFGTTPAGRWLDADSWRYGFILRYPAGQQAVTGIQSEPWHFRYVGTALAEHMHATHQPLLERVFDLPDSPDY